MAWAVPSAALAATFSYMKESLGLNDDNANASTVMSGIGAFVSILGFMVVFRSNQAWSRFWEGSTYLQRARSQWFNAASNLFAFSSRDPAKRHEVREFQELIVRLVSVLFVTALSSVSDKANAYEVLNLEGVDGDTLKYFIDYKDKDIKIELIMIWIQRAVVKAIDEKVIEIDAPLVSRVFNELGAGVICVSSAEKINDIPFPFHYAQMLSVMLIIYSIGAPPLIAYIFQTAVAAAASAFLNVTVLWSVNYLAAEIETPFGNDNNHLPLQQEVERMNALLKMLLKDAAQATPFFTVLEGVGMGRLTKRMTDAPVPDMPMLHTQSCALPRQGGKLVNFDNGRGSMSLAMMEGQIRREVDEAEGDRVVSIPTMGRTLAANKSGGLDEGKKKALAERIAAAQTAAANAAEAAQSARVVNRGYIEREKVTAAKAKKRAKLQKQKSGGSEVGNTFSMRRPMGMNAFDRVAEKLSKGKQKDKDKGKEAPPGAGAGKGNPLDRLERSDKDNPGENKT